MVRAAFFTQGDGGYTNTELPMSPWSPGALNGVAVGGLLAHILESEAPPSDIPMGFARITIDLLGTAPAGLLTPSFSIVRGGKRMQIVQAELSGGGRVVARAQALRVRRDTGPTSITPIGYDLPEAYEIKESRGPGVVRHTERRVIVGRKRAPGTPGAIWMRFDYDLIEGIPLSPLVRTTMLADYGSGIGNIPDAGRYGHPNLDITIYLTREPAGEWLMIESQTEAEGDGVGFTSARLADRDGTFARTHQTLFLQPWSDEFKRRVELTHKA